MLADATASAVKNSDGSYTVTVTVAGVGASAPPSGLKSLNAGALNGLLVRYTGDKLNTRPGQGGVCGNQPKIKYTGTTHDAPVVLRQSASGSVPLEDGSGFGMDVNTSNQAYTWGSVVIVTVNG